MSAPAAGTAIRTKSPHPSKFERAIVVGASSGRGAELAKQLAAEGAHVALVGRRESELEAVAATIRAAGGRAIVAKHDVTAYEDVPRVYEALTKEMGGLDLLVYCSGAQYNPDESVYDFAQDREMIEVNVIGAIAWTQLAAAHFEAQRGGTIVGISSIAGERGRRTMPGYTTSKAAMSTWMEALRNRIARYGVNVVTIKPGFVDTAKTAHLAKKPMVISPAKAAELILKAAHRGGSPSVFVPGQWQLVALIIRHIPSFLFRKLNL